MKINGFPNYSITEDGTVTNDKTGRVRKSNIDTGGYYKIGLYLNGKVFIKRIHRLLALHFIPNPDNKPCVDHINRIRTDNRLENLRWVTAFENLKNKVYKNISGERYIYIGKTQYGLYIHVLKYERKFTISKWTLQQVIDIRDKVLLDNNLTIE